MEVERTHILTAQIADNSNYRRVECSICQEGAILEIYE